MALKALKSVKKTPTKKTVTNIPASTKVTVTIPPENKALYNDAVIVASKLSLSVNDLFRIGLKNAIRDFNAGNLMLS